MNVVNGDESGDLKTSLHVDMTRAMDEVSTNYGITEEELQKLFQLFSLGDEPRVTELM